MRLVGRTKGFSVLVLVLAGVGCRTGASAPPPAAPPPPPWTLEDEAPGPLLWEVQGKGGSVYLFGTVHLLGAEDVPPLALEKFSAAPALVVEIDAQGMSPMSTLARGMLPWKQSLDQMMGPRLWPQLVAAVGPAVPEAALRRFKPWLAGTLLLVSLYPLPKQAMDAWFQEKGAEQKKELIFLERVDEQLAMLEKMMDLAAIEEMLKHLPAQKDAMQGIVAAYRKGDVRTLEATLAMTEGSSPEMMKVLLDQRNQRWLAAIEGLCAKQGGFVAVGAGHLGGANGLVTLLRTRGHTVRRSRLPPS